VLRDWIIIIIIPVLQVRKLRSSAGESRYRCKKEDNGRKETGEAKTQMKAKR
jgi:hypothetical protein